MTECPPIDFTSCKRSLVQADFTGGYINITSDGGAVLLKEIDRRLQLTSQSPEIL